MIKKILESRIKELSGKDKIITSAYRYYEYELICNNGDEEPDEAYLGKLIEEAEPPIEEMYEKQGDDGSLDSDIYKTAVLTAVSCIASRVYDEMDPMTARECMHLGLYAAEYLKKTINGAGFYKDSSVYSVKERLAILWAFAELSRTDAEIRNAYDHSLMAGMPQKMTRQKEYKMIVNMLGRQIFEPKFFAECLESDNETIPDLLVFACLTILMDNGEYFESIADAVSKCVFDTADNEISLDKESRPAIYELVVLLAMLETKYVIDSEESGQDPDSQLIKVIEYNVINEKKKLSEDEKNLLKQRIQSYRDFFN